MGDKKFKIEQLLKQLAIDIHNMTLSELPKFEMYELLTRYQWPVTRNKINFTTIYTKRNLT